LDCAQWRREVNRIEEEEDENEENRNGLTLAFERGCAI
jgi:predicted secreted protein